MADIFYLDGNEENKLSRFFEDGQGRIFTTPGGTKVFIFHGPDTMRKGEVYAKMYAGKLKLCDVFLCCRAGNMPACWHKKIMFPKHKEHDLAFKTSLEKDWIRCEVSPHV